MRDAIGYLSLLDDGNVKAFLHTIRVGEGTADPMGYRRHFGGTHFDSYAAHPNHVITAGLGHNRYSSSAAGAYQFLSKTWAECAAVLELRDFSPRNQDIAALFLIDRRRALDDVLAGRFEQAVAKCAREWASLPGSPYGQPTKTMAQALATYIEAGGLSEKHAHISDELSYAEPEPAHIQPIASALSQEQPMPIPQVVLGLGAALINAFAPLAREKITKELARHTDNPEVAEQVYTAAVESAKALTGQADPIQATVTAMADPATMEKVQDDALSTLERLSPILDKLNQWDKEAWAAEEESRDAASKRAAGDPNDQDVFLTQAIVLMVIGLMASLGILLGLMVYLKASEGTIGTMLGLFSMAAGVVVGEFKTRYQHRYGSSRSSGAKDVVIGELSRKR
jgi:muramidase (phage lysozyme)